MVHVVGENDIDVVITVQRKAQHTDKHEVGEEGKLQPEVLLRVGRCKITTKAVRN